MATEIDMLTNLINEKKRLLDLVRSKVAENRSGKNDPGMDGIFMAAAEKLLSEIRLLGEVKRNKLDVRIAVD